MKSLAPQQDPSWQQYPETIVELYGPEAGLAIDLRKALGEEVRSAIASIGPSQAFGIVTACNPRGRVVSNSENEARTRLLQDKLVGLELFHRCADGVSVDGRHREPGFAVWTSKDRVSAIACEFEQSAFFWFDGSDFWVVGALVAAEPIRLPPELE